MGTGMNEIYNFIFKTTVCIFKVKIYTTSGGRFVRLDSCTRENRNHYFKAWIINR